MKNKTINLKNAIGIISIFAFIFAFFFNLNLLIEKQGKLDADITLSGLKAYAEEGYIMSDTYYEGCFICVPAAASCDVSAQCCYTGEPYCFPIE